MEPLEIIGNPPELAGRRCEEILCQEYWHEGKLLEPVNAVFLKFGETWHRLCFDFGIVFWRSGNERPKGFSAPEFMANYPIVDLAGKHQVKGKILDCYVSSAIPEGSQVSFRFCSGEVLTFRNIGDLTDYCFTAHE
jgi:hypothetical protein